MLAAMDVLSRLHAVDTRLFARIFRQGERKAIVPIARSLSRSGDGYLYVIIPLLLCAIDAEGASHLVLLLALSFTVERALYLMLKGTLKRRRPANAIPGFSSVIIASDKFSFPSGHASAAFLFATCIYGIFGAPALVAYSWACTIAVSRVLLGVHFPGDIVAGAIMGSSIGLLGITLLGGT